MTDWLKGPLRIWSINGHKITEGYGDDRKTMYICVGDTSVFNTTSEFEMGIFRAALIVTLETHPIIEDEQ